MGWHRVTVETDATSVELASDLLWGAGTAAIEERAGTDDRTVVLVAGFAGRAEAEVAAARVRSLACGPVGVAAVTDDGLDGWRPWARPVRTGRFALTPPWCEPLTDGSETLWIDPGRTFGSGSHPTTRLMVALTETIVRPGDRVLDVGTGSGVLAVAAARCGAASVLAIDVDPASPATAAANADANGVAGSVTTASTDVGELADRVRAGAPGYEVVLANLLAATLVELADSLVTVTRPGGHLVVSGLLEDGWRTVADHLAARGAGSTPRCAATVGEVRTEAGWAAVVLRRPDAR